MRRDGVLLGVALVAIAAATSLAVVLVSWDRGGGRDTASEVPDSRGIDVRALLNPRSVLFGDTVQAVADVTLDRRRVDPDSVRVSAEFSPWGVVAEPAQTRRDAGNTTHLRVIFLLRCLTSPCAPSGQLVSVAFPPARVTYADPSGTVAPGDAIELEWPRLAVYSRSSTSILDARGTAIPWRGDLLSLPAVSHRVSPGLAIALLLAGSALLAATAIALIYVVWPRRAPAVPEPEPPPEPELSPLEQALALLEDTLREDGVADRRRALELVSEVLAVRQDDLAEAARALAWSEAAPRVEQTRELATLVRAALDEDEEIVDDEP